MAKRVALTALALVVAGCASQPEKLQSQYVSPVQYASYDCDQIGAEMTRISGRVNDLHASLKSKADGDSAQMAAGLLLLWPALFFLEGGDGPDAQEYSRLKGEYTALEQQNTVKKCSLPQSPTILQASTTPAAVAPAPAVTLVASSAPAAPQLQAPASALVTSTTPTQVAQPQPILAPYVVLAAPPVQPFAQSTASRSTPLANALSQQILPCWQAPAGETDGYAGRVGMNLQISPDGLVQRADPVDADRMFSDPAYRALVESAQQAAFKCSPLNLPPSEYDSWKNIRMNFRHVGSGGV